MEIECVFFPPRSRLVSEHSKRWHWTGDWIGHPFIKWFFASKLIIIIIRLYLIRKGNDPAGWIDVRWIKKFFLSSVYLIFFPLLWISVNFILFHACDFFFHVLQIEARFSEMCFGCQARLLINMGSLEVIGIFIWRYFLSKI